MHVVLASHRYHPVPGGTERMAQLLAENLVAQGHRATVITQREPGVPASESLNGVEVIRLPVRTIAGVRVPSGYREALRRSGGDLFHLHGNRIWCADFYFPFARSFAWPQLLTGHGFYQYAVHPKPWDRWYFERYLPRALRAFDAYACLTDHEQRQLEGWGVPTTKLTQISEGVDLREFESSALSSGEMRRRWGLRAPLVAVYAGGFFENKRVDRLIEAVARVRETWGLVLLGRDLPGSPFNAAFCQRRAHELGVEVVVRGPVAREELVASFLSADAVVSASAYEGFGVTIAEAMAAGRPFVAWRTGAIGQMADSGAGFAVESLDGFVSALQKLGNADLRSQLGDRGRTASVRWSTDTMLADYLRLYEKMLAHHSAA